MWFWWWIAIGCTRHPRVELTTAAVVGGTDTQHEAALAELAAFDQAVGRGRVRITQVVFAPLDGPMGKYDFKGEIILHDALASESVGATIRHELCHVLDHLEGRSDQQAALAPFAAVVDPLRYDTERRRRMEAFADLCGAGPHLASLVGNACADEPSGLIEVANWISDIVWTEVEPLASLPRPDEERVLPLDHEWLPVQLVARVRSDRPYDTARMLIMDADQRPVLAIDPYTGRPEVGELRPPSSRAEFGDAEVAPPPPWLELREGIGWSDGVAAAVTDFHLEGRGRERRVVVWDGTQWRALAEGCHPASRERGRLLLVDGRVWQVRIDGAALRWEAITPLH